MAKVSVIIPIYNMEVYLNRSVSSVVSQSYEDMEILLIDDGSTDKSGQMCDEWSTKDNRIRVIHRQNQGLGATRNFGIHEACGEYVSFLDADDWYDKNAIETMVRVMERTKCDCVTGNMRLVYEDGNPDENKIWNIEEEEYFFHSDEERLKYIVEELCNYRVSWESHTYMYRREFLLRNAIKCHEKKNLIAEDLYFAIQAASRISHICKIPHILYNYWQRKDSMLREKDIEKRFLDVYEVTKLLEAAFRKSRSGFWKKNCA